MANIRVDLDHNIHNGIDIVFKTPCGCSDITGIKIYYLDGDGNNVSNIFTLVDAHGNDVSNLENLFTKDVYIKVILDTVNNKAYIQNADTNAYLEGRFNNITLKNGVNYGTKSQMDSIRGVAGQIFLVLI